MSCNLHLSCTDCVAQNFCPFTDSESDDVIEDSVAFADFLFQLFCEEHLMERADVSWLYMCNEFEDENKELL